MLIHSFTVNEHVLQDDMSTSDVCSCTKDEHIFPLRKRGMTSLFVLLFCVSRNVSINALAFRPQPPPLVRRKPFSSSLLRVMADLALQSDGVGDEDSMAPVEEVYASIPSSCTAEFSPQSAGVGDADPMVSVEALDALVPRSKITPLIKSKSNLEGTLQVSFHFALLGLATAIPRLSLLAMAFVSSFFFNGLHETVHNSAFRSRFLNDAWAHIFGFLCLRPAKNYFYYHWQHHKYTGNKKLDSELQPESFLDLPIETPLGYLAYVTGVPFWIDAVSSIVRHALGDCPEHYMPSDKARREVMWEARTYLALYGVVATLGAAFGTGALLVRLWILPALLGQPFLRFYLLAEHRGRRDSPLIYENTRTMQTNWFYHKLAWSMPFHMEHHAWPSVPFHKLRVAHKLLVDAGGQELFDRGEVDKDLSGRNEYIRFNFKFLRKLCQSKQGANA